MAKKKIDPQLGSVAEQLKRYIKPGRVVELSIPEMYANTALKAAVFGGEYEQGSRFDFSHFRTQLKKRIKPLQREHAIVVRLQRKKVCLSEIQR